MMDYFSFLFQEGEHAQADKHAEVAINADHYNPAGSFIFFLTAELFYVRFV